MRSRWAKIPCSRSRAFPPRSWPHSAPAAPRSRPHLANAALPRRCHRRRKAGCRARYPASQSCRRSCGACGGLARYRQRSRVRTGGRAGDGQRGRGHSRSTRPSRHDGMHGDSAAAAPSPMPPTSWANANRCFPLRALHEEAGRVWLGQSQLCPDRQAIAAATKQGELDRRMHIDRRGAEFAGFTTRTNVETEAKLLRIEAEGRGALIAPSHRRWPPPRLSPAPRRRPSGQALAGIPTSAPRPSSY